MKEAITHLEAALELINAERDATDPQVYQNKASKLTSSYDSTFIALGDAKAVPE